MCCGDQHVTLCFHFGREYIISIQEENEVAMAHSPQSCSFTVTLQLGSEKIKLTNGNVFSHSDWSAGGQLVLCKPGCRSCDVGPTELYIVTSCKPK